jgi:DNA transformation protein and related proteins
MSKTRQPATGKRQTKSAAGRGKLRPMLVSMGFREFVLDQLGGVPDLRAKSMFGGIGLYAGDTFFGIMAADLVYFKVDEKSKRDYEAAGAIAFAPYADATIPATATTYYSVPADVLESAPTMLAWAKTSIAAARAAKKKKKAAV